MQCVLLCIPKRQSAILAQASPELGQHARILPRLLERNDARAVTSELPNPLPTGAGQQQVHPSMPDQPPHPFQTHGFDQYHKGRAGFSNCLTTPTHNTAGCSSIHHTQGTVMGRVGHKQASMLVNRIIGLFCL